MSDKAGNEALFLGLLLCDCARAESEPCTQQDAAPTLPKSNGVGVGNIVLRVPASGYGAVQLSARDYGRATNKSENPFTRIFGVSSFLVGVEQAKC